jgi:urease beta subunit
MGGSPPDDYASVNALAVSGSTVYAGGQFASIGGQSRSNIAALDASSGAALGWNPGADNMINALAVSGSTVFAGGNFHYIGGQGRNLVAALDAYGAATAWNPDPSGQWVNALAVSGSTIYVGGNFQTMGGQTRNNIAALNVGSGVATAWDPNADNQVNALAVSGSTVYAGGSFGSIGGQGRSNLAALDAGSGLATAWSPDANDQVLTIAVSGPNVYVGGKFTSNGSDQGDYHYLAAFATDPGGSQVTWSPNANGQVDALAVSGPTVYAGGQFTTIGGQSCGYLARFSSLPTGSMTLNGDAVYTASTAVTIDSSVAGAVDTVAAGDHRQQQLRRSAHIAFTLVLTPTDATSGVAFTEYRIDGHAWKEGSVVLLRLAVHRKPGSLTRGTHTIQYRSTDAAGNVESIKSCTVKLG